jgi:hypothetical protein
MRWTSLLLGALAVATPGLNGCSRPQPQNGQAASEAAPTNQPATNSADAASIEPELPPFEAPELNEADSAPRPTTGGDGSEIMLNPLSPAEIKAAKLQGELACSFETAGVQLLVARGNAASAERSQGVVKVGDYVEEIGAPGGYNAMVKGTRFDGKGKSIRVYVSGPPQGGGESPPRFASLTYDRADGAKRTFKGYWTCGP